MTGSQPSLALLFLIAWETRLRLAFSVRNNLTVHLLSARGFGVRGQFLSFPRRLAVWFQFKFSYLTWFSSLLFLLPVVVVPRDSFHVRAVKGNWRVSPS